MVTKSVSYSEALHMAVSGTSVSVVGGPGTGKTSLATELAVGALQAENGSEHWAPVLVLTPDRRRASIVDKQIGVSLASADDASESQPLWMLEGPGSHRLVRTVNSYAHLVTGLWSIERVDPVSRIPFVSGAQEDAWVSKFLAGRIERGEVGGFTAEMLRSEAFRMELRNLLARTGELGLLASSLRELGELYSRPFWELGADAFELFAGPDEVPYGSSTPNADTARMPRIAARLLSGWESDRDRLGLLSRSPVPRVLIVDDAQDLTVSGTALVQCLAKLVDQVVILSSPSSAAAAFRGGDPTAGLSLADALQLPSVELSENMRSSASIARVSQFVSSWLPTSTVKDPNLSLNAIKSGNSVRSLLTPNETARDTLIAETLRAQYLLGGVPWDQMAVIVRSSSQVEPIRRRLSREGIPLQSADRPVHLPSVPICRALLDILRLGFNDEQDYQISAEVLADSAAELLTSPLINADSLELYRLVRDLRGSEDRPELDFVGLLEMDEQRLKAALNVASSAREQVLRRVLVARSIWAAKENAAQMAPQAGLWEIWKHTNLGEKLRGRVLSAEADPSDLADSRNAADQLDSVIALFRKADLWSQKNLEGELGVADTAAEFAAEVLAEEVTSDSLVHSGLLESGVSVVTATGSAGHEWEVVCLVGPQSGQWPATGVGSFGNFGELRAIAADAWMRGWEGETPIDRFIPDEGVGRRTSFAQGVREKRIDEARLFNLAVSRARGHLVFFPVENEDAASSVFFTALVDQQILPEDHDLDGAPIYANVGEPLDFSRLVGSLRSRASVANPDEISRSDAIRLLALLAAEGVADADPAQWAATGSISSTAPIIEAGPLRLSPSRIGSIETCGLAWFLNSIHLGSQDIGEGPEEYSSRMLGNLIHEIAEELPHGTRAELHSALESKWDLYGFEKETAFGQRRWEAAKGQIERLANHFDSWKGEVHTEIGMKYSLGSTLVSGRIDRLEVFPDGSARVIDIKTGKHISDKEVDDHVQLLAYQVWLAESGRTSAGAGLLQLKDAKGRLLALQQPLDSERIELVKEEFSDLAATVSGATFVPNDSDAQVCKFCEFRSVCPAKDESQRSME